MPASKKTLLILFGVSGDLSRRKILPAIENLARKRKLPANFNVLGITRREISKESILIGVTENKNLNRILEIRKMYLEKASSYNDLYKYIQAKYENSEVIFYLAVPPEQVKNTIGKIGKSNLQKIKNKKLLIEKPFGNDLKSALTLEAYMKKYFKEDETYRIDHYLLKDISKQIIKKRYQNKALEKQWNKDCIEKIELVASEKLGIEGRSLFYEKTGALRDMVQSHLLSLLSNVLMELPKINKDGLIHARSESLKYLNLPPENTKRAQYRGYRDEVGNPKSTTETFVQIALHSNHSRWEKVKIVLVTGKGLAEKDTYVKIYFKNKELIFRENLNKDRNSYEDVILHAISKNKEFFLSDEKILESWRILDKLQKNWQRNKGEIEFYEKGTSVLDL